MSRCCSITYSSVVNHNQCCVVEVVCIALNARANRRFVVMYPRPLRTRTLPRRPWHLSSLFSLTPSVCATLDRVRSRSSSFSRLVSRRPPPRLARATTTRRRNRLVCRHRPRHRRPRLLAFRSKTPPKPSTRVRFPRTSSTPRSARPRRRRAAHRARAPSSRASSRASSPRPPAPARDADVATTIDRRASARARVAHADIAPRAPTTPSSLGRVVRAVESRGKTRGRARTRGAAWESAEP